MNADRSKPLISRLLVFGAVLLASLGMASIPTAVSSQVIVDPSALTVVYDATAQNCGVRYKPDAPVRAYVRADGKIVAYAGYIVNYAMVGPSIDNLSLDCHPALASVESPDPTRFTDRSWIASTWTTDGRAVRALVHNEYQAHRFPGRCRFREYIKCWYNTVTSYRSLDGGENFQPENPILAIAPAVRFDGALGKHVGFYNPSNIIEQGDYLYSFVFTNGYAGQKPGVCVFRTVRNANPWRWSAWNGTDFGAPVFNPYARRHPATQPCKPVDNLSSIVGSVLWDKANSRYVAATTMTENGKVTIAYATSPDLFHFSKLTPMIDLPTMWSKDCSDRFRYGYPSMVPASPQDRNFSVTGPDGYLFLTRFHVENCKLGEMRDLVRIPYRIQA